MIRTHLCPDDNERLRSFYLGRMKHLDVLLAENRQLLTALLSRARGGHAIGQTGVRWAQEQTQSLLNLYTELQEHVKVGSPQGYTDEEVARLGNLGIQLSEANAEVDWLIAWAWAQCSDPTH